MNSLLFLYLNLIRGPQILAARLQQEEREKRMRLEEEIALGKVPNMVSCKKCDVPVDRLSVPVKGTPTCTACLAKEAEEMHTAKMEMRREIKMSPFLWFQVFIVFLGLTVFIHRNIMPLYY
ncbi:hypothetical protein KXD40_003323 [Peronospora effusa]|uniref:DksA C4-type domain-containing protein n=1 Tax=Peronospora effusa TaxID=542832 RepID=A0A3R7XG41_9STRA|nr:hypothetical protein DD237_007859 [Peronospora effusa]UIZ29922.1 hypothetical protein KXD40_003323 [Peronospora effusa]